MQIQAVADRLAGLPTNAKLRDFIEPWKTCWLALDQATHGQAQEALLAAVQAMPDAERIMHSILSTCPGAPPGNFPTAHNMAADLSPVEWLWPGWMPRGMITLLGAVPGAGKSYLALDLARRIIHGLPFPDGQPVPVPGANILYLDAEGIPQVIIARARSWEMDIKKLYLMLPDPGDWIDLSVGRHRDRLVEMTAALNPALIILDSLGSLTSKGENNVDDVRELFNFLTVLAQDFCTSLLLIHHMRKGISMQPQFSDPSINDIRGSTHIIAIPRSVMALSIVQTQAKPNRNGPRKLEMLKSTFCACPDPLGFVMARLASAKGPYDPASAYLQWGSVPEPYHEPTQLDYCKEWLEVLLRQGEMRPSDAVELGEKKGFGRATIYRAREELGMAIENTQGRRQRGNMWRWVGREGSRETGCEALRP